MISSNVRFAKIAKILIGFASTDIVAPTRLKLREELEGKQIFFSIFQLSVHRSTDVKLHIQTNDFQDKSFTPRKLPTKVADGSLSG